MPDDRKSLATYWWTLLSVIVAAVIAFKIVHSIDAPPADIRSDFSLVLDYLLEGVGIYLGVTVAGVAFLGTVMRAGAHKLRKDKGQPVVDFIGKQLAVVAASLAVWAAVLAVPSLPDFLESWNWLLVIVLVVIALLLLICKFVVATISRKSST